MAREGVARRGGGGGGAGEQNRSAVRMRDESEVFGSCSEARNVNRKVGGAAAGAAIVLVVWVYICSSEHISSLPIRNCLPQEQGVSHSKVFFIFH